MRELALEATPTRRSAARVWWRRLGWACFYAGLSLGAVVMALPMVWMLTTSFKTESAVFAVPIQWIPSPFRPDNYVRAWGMANWGLYFFNSLFVATATTLLNVLFASAAGFGFAKYHFPFRGALFVLVLSTLMIPFQVIMVPLFIITRDLGWLNTYQGLIVPGAVTAFGTFMMRQFMLTIPDELMMAARIDGCGEVGIFWRIMAPLARPAAAALAIFTFTGSWDSLLWPLIVTTKTGLRTLPLGLALFRSEYSTNYTAMMAASVWTTIPIVVLFVALQRHFVQGIVISGLKG
jgi:multiple sugar transport system permease protein